MIEAGIKFSSKPRNGYNHVYEVLEVDGKWCKVRNTSYPIVDGRGKVSTELTGFIDSLFETGEFIKLN